MSTRQPTLSAEHKSAVLDALRSGEYKQGHGFLRQGDCYCVLGVLADVALKLGAKGHWESGTDFFTLVSGEFGRMNRDFLPLNILEFYGQAERRHDLHIGPARLNRLSDELQQELLDELAVSADADLSLMGLNDSGASFELLARVIEEAL